MPLDQEQLNKLKKDTSIAMQEQTLTAGDLARYTRDRALLNPDADAPNPLLLERVQEVQHKIADAMLLIEDSAQAESLREMLPEIAAYNEERMEQLQTDANRSGTDKVKQDALGKKKRASKKRLKEINHLRAAVTDYQTLQAGGQLDAEQAVERSIHKGRRWPNPLRAAMNHFSLGSYDERHGIEDGLQRKADFQPLAIPVTQNGQEQLVSLQRDLKDITTEHGTLKGVLYGPPAQIEATGKLVIFFSGSGGTSASMIPSVATTYAKSGAAVLSADYRGFGRSVSEKVRNGQRTRTGTHLCEASIYEDGRAIYDYAVNTLGYAPSDIILHGFSLGGAVASKIAADVAEESARDQSDVKLGGIVLHSAIDSMYNASKNAMGGFGGAGFLGWAGSGGYNTASHMRRLHRFDPGLPVHYRGGSEENGDQLALSVTKLHQDPQARFVNSSFSNGTQAHQSDDDSAANMNLDVQMLSRMVQFGRSSDLGAPPDDPVGHF